MSPRRFTFPLVALLSVFVLPIYAGDAGALFKSKCAMCHGPDGAGATPMGKKLGLRSLAAPEVQKQSDAVLTGIITDGKGKMPAFGTKLSADEIKSLAAHIRSLAK